MEELNNGQRSDKDGRKLRRKTMLPLSIWLQIARMPEEEQRSQAEKLIADNPSIEVARAQVHRELVKRGQKPRFRPSELSRVIASRTNELGLSLERCSGMKPSELQSMFRGNKEMEAHWMAMSMRQLALSLKIVADALDPPSVELSDSSDLWNLAEAFKEGSETLLDPGRPSLIASWGLSVQKGAYGIK
jgi:hypothetical protein